MLKAPYFINFYPLVVALCYLDPQLQMDEKLLCLYNLNQYIYQSSEVNAY